MTCLRDDVGTLSRPPVMLTLLEALERNEWRYTVAVGRDTGGNEFHSVDAARGRDRTAEQIRASWHSRPTDGRTLRLFSAMWLPPLTGAGGGWRCYLTARFLTERAYTAPGED